MYEEWGAHKASRAAYFSAGFFNKQHFQQVLPSHPLWKTSRLRWLSPWTSSPLNEDQWTQGEEAPHITNPRNPSPTIAGSGDSPSVSERLRAEKGRESRLSSERSNTRIPPQGRQFHFIRKPQMTDENMEKLGMGSQRAPHWKKHTCKSTRITTRVYRDIWPFENTWRGRHQTKEYSYICQREGWTSKFHINTDNTNHSAFSFFFRPFFFASIFSFSKQKCPQNQFSLFQKVKITKNFNSYDLAKQIEPFHKCYNFSQTLMAHHSLRAGK